MPIVKKILQHISIYIFIVSLPISLIFFLPYTQNFYDTNKLGLIVLVTLVMIVLWGFKSFSQNRITVAINPASGTFLALALGALVSIFFNGTNIVESLVTPISLTLFLCLGIISLITGSEWTAKTQTILKYALISATAILSVIAIYMYFGIGKLMFPTITFLTDNSWTPVGSNMALIAILVIVLPLTINELIDSIKKKKEPLAAFSAVATMLIAGGLGLSLYLFIPKISSTVLPLTSAWKILLESYKHWKNLFFGVGAENYLSAFTVGRPAELNTGLLWNIRYFFASSSILHLATVFGLSGIIGLAILFRHLIYNRGLSEESQKLIPSLILSAIAMIICAPHIAIFVTIAILLTLKFPHPAATFSWEIPSSISWVGTATAVICLVLFGVGGFFLGKYYYSEFIFYESLLKAQANDGNATYNLQIQAIVNNPAITNYHITYSQTNIAIANSFAANAQKSATGSATKQISDQDRQTISQLIQQAIREAKLGTTLAPTSVVAWENLARVYQSIIGVVDGADNWAIASYQQAIQLDQTNPVLRLNLAGIYLSQKNTEAATQQLLVATLLKPDLAAPYYNLGQIYLAQKDNLKAAQAYKQTLSLIPVGSSDATKVSTEFDKVKALLTKEELAQLNQQQGTGATDQLSLPNQANTPAPTIEPKLTLPGDASPSTGSAGNR